MLNVIFLYCNRSKFINIHKYHLSFQTNTKKIIDFILLGSTYYFKKKRPALLTCFSLSTLPHVYILYVTLLLFIFKNKPHFFLPLLYFFVLVLASSQDTWMVLCNKRFWIKANCRIKIERAMYVFIGLRYERTL